MLATLDELATHGSTCSLRIQLVSGRVAHAQAGHAPVVDSIAPLSGPQRSTHLSTSDCPSRHYAPVGAWSPIAQADRHLTHSARVKKTPHAGALVIHTDFSATGHVPPAHRQSAPTRCITRCIEACAGKYVSHFLDLAQTMSMKVQRKLACTLQNKRHRLATVSGEPR